MACACGCCRGSPKVLYPHTETRVRIAHVVRPPVVSVGELRGVIYRARRSLGEAPKSYVHFFEGRRPMLATNTAGTRLYIVGGRYRVTKRGIQG